jgi:hypothetical protein
MPSYSLVVGCYIIHAIQLWLFCKTRGCIWLCQSKSRIYTYQYVMWWRTKQLWLLYNTWGCICKKCQAGNYRPVSLTSVACKVLESLVREHIIELMKRNNFFTKKQYGFISGRSTALQLLEVPLAALCLIGNCRSRLLVVHLCNMMLTCYVVAYVVLYQMLSDNPCKHNQ